MERHPERLPQILNDLIDMGLPIDWVQSTDLGIEDAEFLLFSYQFSAPFGEPKGQLYALVHESNHPWMFAPLPTWYGDRWQYGVHVHTVADVNADGNTEVAAELTHAYADGPGTKWQVFAWQDGAWVDRMAWYPLSGGLGREDAFYGEIWLEDTDADDRQEIAVYYSNEEYAGW